MPAGTNFLRSAIDTGSLALVRRADAVLFTEEELPFFNYVRAYTARYGVLPTPEVMAEEGLALSAIHRPATTEYYYDSLRRRFGYTEVSNRHPQFVESMRNQDTEGMLRLLREMVQVASSACESERYTLLSDEVAGVLREYEEAKRNPGLRGIPSGWPTLDHATNGFQGGDLVVVAGRPSMGKSWLLMEMCYNANAAGHVAAFMSMEMSLRQITRRWIGRKTGINPNMIRAGELGTYAERTLYAASTIIENDVPVHLLAGDMRKSVSGIEGMIVEFNPAIVFVDAAYLLSPSGRRQGYISRWESISEVVRELKSLALTYNIPIVITVQFNRNQKTNSTRSPDMGDIAGSDSIPQDASIVMGARRGQQPYEHLQRIIEVMKDREGETPTFATAFTFQPVCFDEVPMSDSEEGEEREDTSWLE